MNGWQKIAGRLGLLLVVLFAARVAYDAAPPLNAAAAPPLHDAGTGPGVEVPPPGSVGTAAAVTSTTGAVGSASAAVAGAGGSAESGGDAGLEGFSLAGLSFDAGSTPSGTLPKQVRFAVVLVQYTGAQGAPVGIRSRDAAAKLAAELGEEARRDFKAAVKRGDVGSTDDAGRIQRGILEENAELALFSSAVGEVAGPVETPRGYWIVKRLE
jgi:hypothetical protein